MTAIEFLMDYCNCGESDSVTYREYEYGRSCVSSNVQKLAQMVERDIEELYDFFEGIGTMNDVSDDEIKERAVKSTYNLWKKKIVLYNRKENADRE